MSYRLVVRPEAEVDLIEVEEWYEQQQTGLGRQFLLAARETIDSLSANPAFIRFVLVVSKCVGLIRNDFPTGSFSA